MHCCPALVASFLAYPPTSQPSTWLQQWPQTSTAYLAAATAARAVAGGGSGRTSSGALESALGLSSSPVFATLVLTTVEGVEALSPISRHISKAACVRLSSQHHFSSVLHMGSNHLRPTANNGKKTQDYLFHAFACAADQEPALPQATEEDRT